MEKMSTMVEKAEASGDSSSSSSSSSSEEMTIGVGVDLNEPADIEAGPVEEGNLVLLECRICQDEDFIDKLETPCQCNGTLKFAHRDCIQRWINERHSMICEICNQPYEPDYAMVLPPPQPHVQTEDVTIGISDGYFTVTSDTPPDVQAQRAQIEAAAEFLRRQQAYNARSFRGSGACRIGAVICLAFLVVKDFYYFYENGEESDLFTIFCVMLGFFLPCYILAWFANVWNQSHDEGLAAASSEVSVNVSQVSVMSQITRR